MSWLGGKLYSKGIMLGGKNRQPLGYTILEVMIVLAVSGVMFLIAANFINGKQARTAFTGGVNEMASKVQDIIQQVTDGKYSDIPLGCTFNGTITAVSTSPAQAQGTNQQCVFLGKILHLANLGEAHDYQVLSAAGGRVAANGVDPIVKLTGAGGADPRVVGALTADYNVPQSLDVINVTATDAVTGAQYQSFAISFFQSQGSVDDKNNLQNGTQAVNLYYIRGLTQAANNTLTLNNDSPVSPNLFAASRAEICLSDGTRFAMITLGTNNNQLTANVTMNGMTPCP